MSIEYEDLLLLHCSFTVAVLHVTQWMVCINASIKVFLDEWMSSIETRLKENMRTLPKNKAFVLDTWTVPGSFFYWAEFREEARQSLLQSTIWQICLQFASLANEPQLHHQVVGQKVTAILFPILNNAQLCHPAKLASVKQYAADDNNTVQRAQSMWNQFPKLAHKI